MKPEIRQDLKLCILATTAFSLAANSFAYFNLTPHHDAINHTLLFNSKFEIAIGRFLHPVWGKLMGDITTPWFTGLLSILFLSIAVWMCVDILKIRSRVGIIVSAGFLSVNYSIIELCGTFGYVLGAYTFAIMLVCAGAWVVTKHQGIFAVLVAAVLICISMGLYPAYVTVGFTLFLIMLMQQTVAGEGFAKNIRAWIRYITSFAMGGALYFGVYKVVLFLTGIEPRNTYSSPSQLLNMDIKYLIKGLVLTYKCFIRFWILNAPPATLLISVVNLILFVTTVVLVFKRVMKQKQRVVIILLFFLCVALFPLASMLMQLLMQRNKMDFLVSYAVFLFYPGCFSIIEACAPELHSMLSEKKTFWKKYAPRALYFACALVLFTFIRFSNQSYTVSKVIYDRTLTAVSTIIVEMNESEEYIPGKTEVVVIGRLNSKDNNITSTDTIDRFRTIEGYGKVSITYPLTFDRFFRLMGHPINMIQDTSVISLYENNSEITEMPSYPAEGYCRMVDGRMVIKLQ